MKVELLPSGTLRVAAENGVESFALSHWHALWSKGESSFLVTTVQRSDENPLLHPEFTTVEAPR